MARRLLLLAALLCLMTPAFAQRVDREKLALRFIKPSTVIQMLAQPPSVSTSGEVSAAPNGAPQPTTPKSLLPSGITQILPNDRDNTLLVRGTAEAIRDFKETIRLLDVAPRQVKIGVRVVRVQFFEDGKTQEQELGTGTVVAASNRSATLSVGGRTGYSLSLQPRINGDDSVTITGEFNVLSQIERNRYYQNATRNTRRVADGETRRLLGVSDSKDESIRVAVAQGRLPEQWAPATFTAIYLEVTPGVIKDGLSPAVSKP